MLLSEIFKNAPDIEIKQLSCDSRIPMKDCIFFCLKGIKYDGHNYVKEAIENGAKVVIYSDPIDTSLNAIFIKVSDVLNYLIKISNLFYDYPQSKLFTYLVAGTYGRPCVSTIITNILKNKVNVGSIGVFGIRYGENSLTSSKPTLTILDTQKYLHQFVNEGVKAVTLEANNLSFDFRKLNYLKPNVFIYTNTSKEKIYKKNDYISTIQRYLYTLDDSSLIVLNKDDISFNELFKATGNNFVTYGQDENSDYLIKNVYTSMENSIFTISHNGTEVNFTTDLIGLSNVYNLVGAIVALAESGFNINEMSLLVRDLGQIPGVYEKINTDRYNIVVDAAFYKESYENILSFIEKHTVHRVLSLISISTSDDKKRISGLMELAEKYSDEIIVTEDINQDDKIIDNLNLCSEYVKSKPLLLIEDRTSAIETGIDLLNEGDTLLILGKGNEKYIDKGYIKIQYEGDSSVVYNYLNKLKQDESLYDDYNDFDY